LLKRRIVYNNLCTLTYNVDYHILHARQRYKNKYGHTETTDNSEFSVDKPSFCPITPIIRTQDTDPQLIYKLFYSVYKVTLELEIRIPSSK